MKREIGMIWVEGLGTGRRRDALYVCVCEGCCDDDDDDDDDDGCVAQSCGAVISFVLKP